MFLVLDTCFAILYYFRLSDDKWFPFSMYQILSRTSAAILSGGLSGKKLTVLIFHRILPHKDPYQVEEIDAKWFDELVGYLKEIFAIVPLSEALDMVAEDRLISRSLSITFDDGYADNFEVALPILKRQRVCATFFISTGFSDGRIMWNDKVLQIMRTSSVDFLKLADLGLPDCRLDDISSRYRSALKIIDALKYHRPEDRDEVIDRIAAIAGVGEYEPIMMRDSQIKSLFEQGMEIGAHTVNHPILARLNEDEARSEIIESKRFLENLLGVKIRMFAYPNGKYGSDYTDRDVRIVRNAGFDYALTTHWGTVNKNSDFAQLPRFTPWDRDKRKFVMRLLINYLR